LDIQGNIIENMLMNKAILAKFIRVIFDSNNDISSVIGVGFFYILTKY